MTRLGQIRLTQDQLAVLTALANGIIPPDQVDGGAEEVGAGLEIAQRVERGIHAETYVRGLAVAEELAISMFAERVTRLNPEQLHALVGVIKERIPQLYKQLRADVCQIYLSDPTVWKRIGFPGPSAERGGYPDFDQPQRRPGE